MKLKILKSREAQIGFLIAIILALFIWGFNFLKGRNILTPANYYYCTFEDVGGLMESNFVMIRGYKVGLVEDIKLSRDTRKLIVTMVLEEENLKIAKGSKAVLYNLDMLGTKAVKLELVPGTEYYESGDTIPSNIQKDMLSTIEDQLSPLKDKITSVISGLDSVITSVNNTFNAQTVENLQTTISNLNTTSASIKNLLADKGSSLNKTIDNLKSITADLNHPEEGIKPILSNIGSISDSLANSNLKSVVSHLDSTLASLQIVMNKISVGEGSMGKLVNNEELYNNLSASTASLNILLEDMKAQPSKYVKLSLIDWGKDVYIDDDGVTKKLGDETSYIIVVKQTNQAMEINEGNFKEASQINEMKQDDHFYYY